MGWTHGDWHAAHRLLRHRRAEEEVSAAAGIRGDCRRLCPVGVDFGFGCDELPRPRCAIGGRQALRSQWREDVDYQRWLRRPVYGVCEGGWREVLGISCGEKLSWILGRRRRAQDGDTRIV